jgi:hypothetical protein
VSSAGGGTINDTKVKASGSTCLLTRVKAVSFELQKASGRATENMDEVVKSEIIVYTFI